ncbi:MAG: hypothetical protein ABIA76_03755 [Candidatus Diapherotrites archaeon]
MDSKKLFVVLFALMLSLNAFAIIDFTLINTKDAYSNLPSSLGKNFTLTTAEDSLFIINILTSGGQMLSQYRGEEKPVIFFPENKGVINSQDCIYGDGFDFKWSEIPVPAGYSLESYDLIFTINGREYHSYPDLILKETNYHFSKDSCDLVMEGNYQLEVEAIYKNNRAQIRKKSDKVIFYWMPFTTKDHTTIQWHLTNSKRHQGEFEFATPLPIEYYNEFAFGYTIIENKGGLIKEDFGNVRLDREGEALNTISPNLWVDLHGEISPNEELVIKRKYLIKDPEEYAEADWAELSPEEAIELSKTISMPANDLQWPEELKIYLQDGEKFDVEYFKDNYQFDFYKDGKKTSMTMRQLRNYVVELINNPDYGISIYDIMKLSEVIYAGIPNNNNYQGYSFNYADYLVNDIFDSDGGYMDNLIDYVPSTKENLLDPNHYGICDTGARVQIAILRSLGLPAVPMTTASLHKDAAVFLPTREWNPSNPWTKDDFVLYRMVGNVIDPSEFSNNSGGAFNPMNSRGINGIFKTTSFISDKDDYQDIMWIPKYELHVKGSLNPEDFAIKNENSNGQERHIKLAFIMPSEKDLLRESLSFADSKEELQYYLIKAGRNDYFYIKKEWNSRAQENDYYLKLIGPSKSLSSIFGLMEKRSHKISFDSTNVINRIGYKILFDAEKIPVEKYGNNYILMKIKEWEEK